MRALPALAFAALLACGCPRRPPQAPPPSTTPAPGLLKGALHAHTSFSGDSATPPEAVARWYAARGYDFVVLTDHNRIGPLPRQPPLLVIPGVELTQNFERCEPADARDEGERPAREASAAPRESRPCLLHLNALFVREAEVPPPAPLPTDPPRRLDVYARALALNQALGGLAQLNHPNFNFAAGPGLIALLARRGVRLIEIANEAQDSQNAGDAEHPSTVALWDAALTRGARLFGVASDDAHHYDDAAATAARGEAVFPGDRGWVMVRAPREAGAIRRALERGDFYATTGVRLARLEASGGALSLELEPGAAPHRFRFVGLGGQELAQSTGVAARFELQRARGGYVRAEVTAPGGARAWTQPVWP